MLVRAAQANLKTLEAEFAGRLYLLGDEFTVPDILLISVLRFIQHTDLLEDVPAVSAYKERCEARPAWKRVLAAHETRLGS